MVVTPQSPECYPPSYPSAMSPTHHLPPYLTHHPHFIQNSHTAYYPPVTVPGDMPPQFFPQPHLPPTIYSEQGEWVPAGLEICSTMLRSRPLGPSPLCHLWNEQGGRGLPGTKLTRIPSFPRLGFCFMASLECVRGSQLCLASPSPREGVDQVGFVSEVKQMPGCVYVTLARGRAGADYFFGITTVCQEKGKLK